MPQQSKTILLDTLKKAKKYLTETNAPSSLLFDIDMALRGVVWDHDPKGYFADWLASNPMDKLSAEPIFCAGFNMCQELMEYEFGIEY